MTVPLPAGVSPGRPVSVHPGPGCPRTAHPQAGRLWI